jgi:uncharacterized RDD family membrane protein YckC
MPIQKPPHNNPADRAGDRAGNSDEKLSPLQRYLEKKKKTQAPTSSISSKKQPPAQNPNGDIPPPPGRFTLKHESPSDLRALEQGVPLAPPTVATSSAPIFAKKIVSEPAVSSDKEVDLASFGARFVALVIDAAILRGLQMMIETAIAGTFGILPASIFGFIEWPLNKFAFLVLLFFYFGWFYSEKGATPGKLLLNLQVVQSDTGERLTYLRAFLRETLGKMISGVLLCLGFLIAAFRNDHRALHDMIFDTRVIEKPR